MTESPLEKVLRLAAGSEVSLSWVGAFQRRSSRGRVENVRAHQDSRRPVVDQDTAKVFRMLNSDAENPAREERERAASAKAHQTAHNTASRDAKEDWSARISEATHKVDQDYGSKPMSEWNQKADWAHGQVSHHLHHGNVGEAANWVDKMAEAHGEKNPKVAAKLRGISAEMRKSTPKS
jgi:hypothetical protein